VARATAEHLKALLSLPSLAPSAPAPVTSPSPPRTPKPLSRTRERGSLGVTTTSVPTSGSSSAATSALPSAASPGSAAVTPALTPNPSATSGRGETDDWDVVGHLDERPACWAGLLGWALTRWLGGILDPEAPAEHTRALFDEWLLGRTLQRSFQQLGLDESAAYRAMGLTQVLLCHERELSEAGQRSPRQVIEGLLQDGDVRDFLGVNRYRGVLWFNQERFDDLIGGLLATALVTQAVSPTTDTAISPTTGATVTPAEAATALARAIRTAELQSGYQLERLLRLLPA